MGDGYISWEKPEPAAEECKTADITPRSDIEEDTTAVKESVSVVPSLPLVLEELHRNVNDTVNTPDVSNASIQSPTSEKQAAGTPRRGGRRNFRIPIQTSDSEYGLPLGPAAGLGPQETTGNDANQEIYSVRGTRSLKISRHRDFVSVFPSGCMGIMDEEDLTETPTSVPAVLAPAPTTAPAPAPTTAPAPAPTTAPVLLAAGSPSSTSSNTTTGSNPLVRPNSATRNPLTGEGYKNQAKKQSPTKKKDGNPVLGQGYAESTLRTKKIPPGGFSQGLW